MLSWSIFGFRKSVTTSIWSTCQDPASTSPFVSTGNVGGVCSVSGPTHTSGVLTLLAYSHFRRIRTPYVSSVFSRYPSRPAWSLRGSSHTPCVGSLFSRYPSCSAWSLRGSSYTPCVGSLFLRYPSRPAWSLRGSSHTPCVGSLFSRYPSRPAWSLRGSSNTPCVGSLFSRYPSRPAWSLRGTSHTPCVGSLFSGSGGRSAGHGDREVGLWREIIFNVIQVRSGLQPICAPPRRTTPVGFPSFPSAESKQTDKQTNQNTQ